VRCCRSTAPQQESLIRPLFGRLESPAAARKRRGSFFLDSPSEAPATFVYLSDDDFQRPALLGLIRARIHRIRWRGPCSYRPVRSRLPTHFVTKTPFKKVCLVAAAFCAAAAFVVAYRAVLVKLVHDWLTDDNYSHGLFVVPLALYFAWRQRERLAS